METRSKIFGAVLRGLGTAASFLERVLTATFKRSKKGFALIEEEINKSGLKEFLRLAGVKIISDVNFKVKTVLDALGLRQPGGTEIDRRMGALSEARRRVDILRKNLPEKDIRATVSRPGEITINNQIVINAGGFADVPKLRQAVREGLGDGVIEAKKAFRPPERSRSLKGRADLAPN